MSSYHAFPRSGRWVLHRTGGKRALRLYRTRREAWTEAQRRAKSEGGVAYLHDATGRITHRVPGV